MSTEAETSRFSIIDGVGDSTLDPRFLRALTLSRNDTGAVMTYGGGATVCCHSLIAIKKGLSLRPAWRGLVLPFLISVWLTRVLCDIRGWCDSLFPFNDWCEALVMSTEVETSRFSIIDGVGEQHP